MDADTTPDLAGLCAELAAELDEVTSTTEGEMVAYARDGAVFARVSGSRLDVRLPAAIAAAAVRTPDATLDPEDRGWVRFTPADDEGHVFDRAAAWFETGWRHANDH